ncbi:Holliday junction resolvase RuvX [Aquisediminimonas sediminicola]|uniref:Holliday junction resolvase RuvX n=1 Tax=Alteraquisediminimonas sediminicola TaxID=2676787 RepID=UPI001C8D82FA|nr:Holliday junction resolvase RuvX [Aquisediminimonas sediminicola]
MITDDAVVFSGLLPHGGPLLGLDIGTKTIGLAICDQQWTIASSLALVRRTKFTADLESLRTLCAQRSVTGIVAGLPLNLDGTDSPRTQSVRAFVRNLAPLDLPILLWDERWSTQAVTRTLLEADASRARRAELVDKIAAAYILQGAIDRLAGLV